jgi:hypothetical protein
MSLKDSKITTNQARCISALLEYSTIQEAASEVGINPRTVYRWMNEPVFMAALRKAETGAISDAVRALLVDLQNNHQVMRDIRDNVRYSPSVRLRAASMLDQSALRWSEMRELKEVIESLEERISEIENRQTEK